MAKQDDFVRITLRLPAGLHDSLTREAGARSLNAEIVQRLEDSFRTTDNAEHIDRLYKNMDRLLALADDLRKEHENSRLYLKNMAEVAKAYHDDYEKERAARISLEKRLNEILNRIDGA